VSNPNATPSASWIIGSDHTYNIVVAQPSVSAKHCRLLLFCNGFILEDLGSTNGTYVNSYRLQPRAVRAVAHFPIVTEHSLQKTLPDGKGWSFHPYTLRTPTMSPSCENGWEFSSHSGENTADLICLFVERPKNSNLVSPAQDFKVSYFLS
jgi:hypothetical protein